MRGQEVNRKIQVLQAHSRVTKRVFSDYLVPLFLTLDQSHVDDWVGGGAAFPIGNHPWETDAGPLELCDLRECRCTDTNRKTDLFKDQSLLQIPRGTNNKIHLSYWRAQRGAQREDFSGSTAEPQVSECDLGLRQEGVRATLLCKICACSFPMIFKHACDGSH